MQNQSALRNLVAFVATVGIFLSLGACKFVKVVPQEQQSKGKLEIYFADKKFNPDKIVADMWDSKILPFADKHAIKLALVLAALQENREKAGKQFGHREKAEGSPWNYVIKTTAKVIEVNTKSRAARLGLDIRPYDGKTDAWLQIGPVIKGTSIRDSLDFLNFDNFTNQLEFARLSNAINKKVNSGVVAELDRNALEGIKLTVSGMFTDNGLEKPILITPVRVQTAHGG